MPPKRAPRGLTRLTFSSPKSEGAADLPRPATPNSDAAERSDVHREDVGIFLGSVNPSDPQAPANGQRDHMNRPWFPFNVSQIESATRHLTAAQYGAFVRLMAYQWEHQSIPDAPSMMARIAGVYPPQWGRTWAALKPLFTTSKDGHGVLHDPLHVEYLKSVEISNKRKEAGSANANTRARGLNTSQSEVSKKEPLPAYESEPGSNLISLPPTASPTAGQRKGPASEFDWESSDGRIFISAEQITTWGQKYPLLDIRAQLRHAKRNWLSDELSQVSFGRRFEKGLHTMQQKAEKRATKKAQEDGTQKSERDLAWDHQRIIDAKNAKADEVRRRLGYG